AGGGRQDAGAGGGQVRAAGVAAAGDLVVGVRRGHAQDVRHAGRVGHHVLAAVAGGRHHHHAVLPRVLDGLGQRGRVVVRGEAHHDDLRAVFHGPQHAGDHVHVVTGAVRVQHLHGGDVDPGEGDAGDPGIVVRVGHRDAGQGRAVAVRVCVRVTA